MKHIKIVNYFVGNIFSVVKSFEYFDCQVELASNPEQFQDAEYLVLPGVGAFGDGIANLRKAGLDESILEFIRGGKPFLGICLGMQLLLTESEEFGHHKGLNVIDGKVAKLPPQPEMKIPHVSWNSLVPPEGRSTSFWDGSILEAVPLNADMYFVHSFAAYPNNPEDWLSRTHYGDHWFCSGLQNENVYGCQFHPEKSGPVGLRIIENFLSQ